MKGAARPLSGQPCAAAHPAVVAPSSRARCVRPSTPPASRLRAAGITLTYVTKAAGPVATIMLCALGLGRLPSSRALLAVPLVMLGVALSVWGNGEFEPYGFGAACASTAFQTLLGMSGKKAMAATGVSGQSAHWLMCALILAASAAHYGALCGGRRLVGLADGLARQFGIGRAGGQHLLRLGSAGGGGVAEEECGATISSNGFHGRGAPARPLPHRSAGGDGLHKRGHRPERAAASSLGRALHAGGAALTALRGAPANGRPRLQMRAAALPPARPPSAPALLQASAAITERSALATLAARLPLRQPRSGGAVGGAKVCALGPPLPCRVGLLPLGVLRLLAPIAFYLEYSLMFSYAALVDSVTLSVSDTVRRSAIVYSGRLLFGGDRLRAYNVVGVVMALLGATLYALLASTKVVRP